MLLAFLPSIQMNVIKSIHTLQRQTLYTPLLPPPSLDDTIVPMFTTSNDKTNNESTNALFTTMYKDQQRPQLGPTMDTIESQSQDDSIVRQHSNEPSSSSSSSSSTGSPLRSFHKWMIVVTVLIAAALDSTVVAEAVQNQSWKAPFLTGSNISYEPPHGRSSHFQQQQRQQHHHSRSSM